MIDRIIAGSVHDWMAALAGIFLLSAGSALAEGQQHNAITGLKAVNAGESYEITVAGSEPFLRSDLPVLRIGDQEITISRAPDDGSSDRRVFILTRAEFLKAKSGDRVVFQWGSGEGRKQLDFGTLDKARLQK